MPPAPENFAGYAKIAVGFNELYEKNCNNSYDIIDVTVCSNKLYIYDYFLLKRKVVFIYDETNDIYICSDTMYKNILCKFVDTHTH